MALPTLLTSADEYSLWAMEMKSYLTVEGVWNVVAGAVVPEQGFCPETDRDFYHILPDTEDPPTGDAPAAPRNSTENPRMRIPRVCAPRVVANRKYQEESWIAIAYIQSRVDGNLKKILLKSDCAHAVWRHLEKLLDCRRPVSEANMLIDLLLLRSENYPTVEKFVLAYMANLEDQKEAGFSPPSVFVLHRFLDELPQTYATFKSSILHRLQQNNAVPPTMYEVIIEFHRTKATITFFHQMEMTIKSIREAIDIASKPVIEAAAVHGQGAGRKRKRKRKH